MRAMNGKNAVVDQFKGKWGHLAKKIQFNTLIIVGSNVSVFKLCSVETTATTDIEHVLMYPPHNVPT
jgi:hypothetical protein